jgi:hypothetical protein
MRLLRSLVTVAVVVTAAVAAPGTAARAEPAGADGALVLPVSWAEFRGTFNGALTVDRFAAGPAGLVALGRLRGTTNSRYGPETVDQPASVPVLAIAATCEAVHLELGPLDPRPPSRVGLHLDRLVADITPLHPGLVGRLQLCGLRAAIARGAPAGELALRLNLLLPELADSTISTQPRSVVSAHRD